MKSLWAGVVPAAMIVLCCLMVMRGSGVPQPSSVQVGSTITIDYPLNGSIFPPEITAPTFLWHDNTPAAKRWVVTVSFADRSPAIEGDTPGELMAMGEIDPKAGTGDQLYPLTEHQKTTHTWQPDEKTWAQIKAHSMKSPARITVAGFPESREQGPVSTGIVSISTSTDPVGAPIFYRDVPLMLSPPDAKGAISPLPPSAIPMIKWRLRDIAQPRSRVVMENLPTCANCHSFSSDGKTLGLDLDGPKNDKGLYALVQLAKQSTIRNQDVIRWSSFQDNLNDSSEPAVKRFGFMSQVSPNGQYVVTSIAPPTLGNEHQKENPDFAPGLSDRLFSINYQRDIRFIQVFYPTRGILAFYDRKEQKLRPLPGADDPRFVHTSAFWSPDGKYLIFSRAEAFDPYPPGAPKPEYANDPREPLIQYDLYRIPFNDGHGGKAEPITGASHNGMSNNFPKVSPDGRWIVFVQNHSGLLMRPDSRLYIVPFAGGKARPMTCNTPLMNSWHSFSPNGRWLAFSSKGRSPYTQLMLTHIDEHGNDSPAIMVENTTLANRAVNIPEFLNIHADGLEKIDPEATKFYQLITQAYALMEENRMTDAIPVIREAVEHNPDEGMGHIALALALTATNQENDALEEYRKACALNPRNAAWLAHYAVSLSLNDKLDEAIESWRKSLALDPTNPHVEADLGAALLQAGKTQEGIDHLQKALEMDPKLPDAHNYLGLALSTLGRTGEAIGQMKKAIALVPDSIEYRFNLGHLAQVNGDFADSIAAFGKAVELSSGKDWRCLAALAEAYDRAGRAGEAVEAARRALDLALAEHDDQLEANLRTELQRYERDAAQTR